MKMNPRFKAKLDRDYVKLANMSRRLGIPATMMRVALVATGPDGVKGDSYEGWSRTFVRNYYNHLWQLHCAANGIGGGVFGSGSMAIKGEDGALGNSSYAVAASAGQGFPNWGSGAATLANNGFGIVIGTGTTNESFESFKLTAKLVSGNGSGQMAYSAQNATVITFTELTRTWSAVFTRIFNNNSGASIVIAETALMAALAQSGTNFFSQGAAPMMARDLLPSPVTVLNAGQLTVTYTIQMVMPLSPTNDPPFMGGSAGGSARISNQAAAHPVRNWQEQRDPRNWQSTEQWQRLQMRRTYIP